jgi:LacI family transcriptional regulator
MQHPEVTAVLAYNDLRALGAVQACRDLGRRIPTQCAIIGFDDIRLAAMVRPSLTSVRVDKYYLGQQAMVRLLAMLNEPANTFPPVHVDVELVVRESAPPARNREPDQQGQNQTHP